MKGKIYFLSRSWFDRALRASHSHERFSPCFHCFHYYHLVQQTKHFTEPVKISAETARTQRQQCLAGTCVNTVQTHAYCCEAMRLNLDHLFHLQTPPLFALLLKAFSWQTLPLAIASSLSTPILGRAERFFLLRSQLPHSGPCAWSRRRH